MSDRRSPSNLSRSNAFRLAKMATAEKQNFKQQTEEENSPAKTGLEQLETATEQLSDNPPANGEEQALESLKPARDLITKGKKSPVPCYLVPVSAGDGAVSGNPKLTSNQPTSNCDTTLTANKTITAASKDSSFAAKKGGYIAADKTFCTAEEGSIAANEETFLEPKVMTAVTAKASITAATKGSIAAVTKGNIASTLAAKGSTVVSKGSTVAAEESFSPHPPLQHHRTGKKPSIAQLRQATIAKYHLTLPIVKEECCEDDSDEDEQIFMLGESTLTIGLWTA